MAAAIEHVYRYASPSTLDISAGMPSLSLAAEVRERPNAALFDGRLTDAALTARCLRAVSNLVATRFHIPPAMLARIILEADPVVTVAPGVLRFEGFSACCSTYIRHDVLGGGFSADATSPGTTNVDFRADMRAALARVRPGAPMRLGVRSDSVELHSGGQCVVERKVPLPVRWIKGFAEVQSYLATVEPRFSLTRVQAQRFLRSLPRAASKQAQWLVPAGAGLRLAHRGTAGGVRIKGSERLRVLEGLVNDARALHIHASDVHHSNAWVLDLGTQRLTLVLSPEPWRGFSGEGQLLEELARAESAPVASVRAQLNWQSELDCAAIASATGQAESQVTAALVVLASRGLLGFDVCTGAYFHRVLPFDLKLVAAMHPRLRDARALLEQGLVTLAQDGGVLTGEIVAGSVRHRVSLDPSGNRCTCPWYARHRGERGPCKHVLAVQILAEGAA